jgi:hypothetical protein
MNRAFFIILIPPLLVLIGYVVVFRAMGGARVLESDPASGALGRGFVVGGEKK